MQWLWNPSFEICKASKLIHVFTYCYNDCYEISYVRTIMGHYKESHKNHRSWVSKYSTNTFTNSSVHFEDSWVSLYPPYLWAICLINDTLHKHLKYNGSCNTSKWTSIYSFYQPFKSLNITFALVFKRKDKPSMH